MNEQPNHSKYTHTLSISGPSKQGTREQQRRSKNIEREKEKVLKK